MDRNNFPDTTDNKQQGIFRVRNGNVRQALSEILIDTYTLEFEGFGQPLLSELEMPASAGVRVVAS